MLSSPSSTSQPSRQRSITPPSQRTASGWTTTLLAALALALPALPFASANDILSPFSCHSITFPSSKKTYDLSSIHYPVTYSNLETTPPSETRTTLQIDLCKPLALDSTIPQRDQCPPGTRICILIETIKDATTLLTQAIPVAWSDDDDGNKIDVQLEHDKADEGFTLEFPGATYAERKQKVEVELVCDPRADENSHPTSQKYDRAKGKLQVTWATKFVCSSSSSPSSPNAPSRNDGGGDKTPAAETSSRWGFFSWLLFLVFAGFAVYMAAGMYRNYNQYGASGWDLVPNRDFWRESPYIAKDAASHIWRSLAGGSGSGARGSGYGGGRGAYEPL